MTLRIFTLATAVGALALAGCDDTGRPAGGAVDLDSLGTADPFDQLAYNSGYSAAQQFTSQYDSTFSYDLFAEGFRDGMDGDSARIAYALGLRAGLELRADTVSNINADVFLAGLREGLEGADSRLSDEQLERAYEVVQDSLGNRQRRNEEASQIASLREEAATNPAAAERLASIDRNRTAADSFLTDVRGRTGVRATESGLLYTVTTPGEGPKPTPQSEVSIEYVGKFMDGEVFDQSQAGQPVSIPVRAVVPGFREALLDMRPGESRTIYLPPDLAYGVLGAPGPGGAGGIPPNSALVFDLTLVEVVAATPQGLGGALTPGR